MAVIRTKKCISRKIKRRTQTKRPPWERKRGERRPTEKTFFRLKLTGDHSVDTSFVKNQNRQADKEEKILYILGTVQKITMKEKTFHLGHKLII